MSGNTARRSHAQRYAELLANTPGDCDAVNRRRLKPVYHLYVIRVTDGRRDALQTYLNAGGDLDGFALPHPGATCRKHMQIWPQRRGISQFSERIAEQGLSLPMFAELTDDQIIYITEKIMQFIAKLSGGVSGNAEYCYRV